MLKAKDYPAKTCLYCGKRMNLSLDMQILIAFEPPMKVISSGGVPLITYTCHSCGFIACFDASVIKKESI
jgi:hypothetical protein